MSPTGLADLLAVQDDDLVMDQLRHRREHLPEMAEHEALNKEAEAVLAKLAQVDRDRTELSERQAEVESELAAAENRASAIDRRLYGGEVAASRDLQAMSSELDQLKGRISSLEDSVLEMLEAREPLDGQAAALQSRLEDLQARREDAASRLQAAQAEVDSQLQEVAARRATAAEAVPAGLLATYESLRGRLGGVGVARLVGNRCGGCHLTLSSMELDHLRHLGEDELYQCEQCSRIIAP